MHVRVVAAVAALGLVVTAAAAGSNFQISAGTSSNDAFLGESIGLDFRVTVWSQRGRTTATRFRGIPTARQVTSDSPG